MIQDARKDAGIRYCAGLQITEADQKQDRDQDEVFQTSQAVSVADPNQDAEDPAQDLREGIPKGDLSSAMAAASFQKQETEDRDQIDCAENVMTVIATGTAERIPVSADAEKKTAQKRTGKKQDDVHTSIIPEKDGTIFPYSSHFLPVSLPKSLYNKSDVLVKKSRHYFDKSRQ